MRQVGYRLTDSIGKSLRSVASSLESFGLSVQGPAQQAPEKIPRQVRIIKFDEKAPVLKNNVFVAPNASVLGDVMIGARSSIFYGTILRGDEKAIKIGSFTTISDGANVRGSTIGDFSVIGTGSILNQCTIGNECLVGQRVVLNGVVMEKQSQIRSGSILDPGTKIPTGELWSGSPAKFERELTEEEKVALKELAESSYQLGQIHFEEHQKNSLSRYGDKVTDNSFDSGFA
eukprot:TRINITY_DN2890_c0_g1_i1.p1 TRINITY_DN2890_c0_g1~~TRINITY_DN2890_c0_g1_i1.p1  ORF type:complete len:231 (-),score=35.60 TRINITY_DN2890_c0_g1_i1:133-825(-)